MLYDGELPCDSRYVCKRLIINMPPRHGKTRTLVRFCEWALGVNNSNRIIACSYNDETASDFSRYTRDGIAEKPNSQFDIVFSDIFPETRLKDGNAAFEKWALRGQHFNYIGAGIGGSITGKGGSLLINDDPIKDARTAFNENALDEIWRWYTGTFLSRKEEGALEILNMTRWAMKDPCGRTLDGPNADQWYQLRMEVFSNGEMLCPSLLSYQSYMTLKAEMDPMIFAANYHQEPFDLKGTLYHDLKTYDELPRNEEGQIAFDKRISYTDTADQGNDYHVTVVAGVHNRDAWLLDVQCTKDGMEITEPQTAEMLLANRVHLARIESNNGGRGFARAVRRLLGPASSTDIQWFHQSENKQARILTMSNFVMLHVHFPSDWKQRWPEFAKMIGSYQREGKNEHDDGPDALTGLAEMIAPEYEISSEEWQEPDEYGIFTG